MYHSEYDEQEESAALEVEAFTQQMAIEAEQRFRQRTRRLKILAAALFTIQLGFITFATIALILLLSGCTTTAEVAGSAVQSFNSTVDALSADPSLVGATTPAGAFGNVLGGIGGVLAMAITGYFGIKLRRSKRENLSNLAALEVLAGVTESNVDIKATVGRMCANIPDGKNIGERIRTAGHRRN